ncbi:MAG: peptide ABC transporter substrate-binding protein [Oscillospiraceae bacterium]|nr:peptide ABC transporter substrate-binding protein [Oscillospiraceae bacterium]
MLKKTICALLSGAMLLLGTACSESEESGTGFLFTCALAGNPACLDPQYTDNENADIVVRNIMEGLVRLDENGVPEPAGAESYTISEDGLYYMFNLREDCRWYKTGMDEENTTPVTAQDYVFAFRRIVDPVTASPYAQEFACLKNANAIMAGTMDIAELGVSAPDDTTVIFRLEYTNPEFLQLLSQPCAVPCNEEFFLSTNGRYGLDLDTVLCNGAFYPSKWNYDPYGSDNFINFRKNPTHYDAENIAPSSLTFYILKSQADADALFANDGADVLSTMSSCVKYMESKEHTVTSEYAETMGLIFHPDNEILQNEDLRHALAYAIDRSAYAPVLSADLKPAYGIIPPAVNLLGSSYREIYADEPLAHPYDPTKAAELFDKAEKALHLNSMNTIRIMVSTDIKDTDALLTICQEWQTLFGQYIGLETVSPDEYEQRIAAGDYSIALYSIGPERNSCYEMLRQFSVQQKLLGFSSEEFTGILAELSNTGRAADSVKLYGMAEQAILDSMDFIPLFYKNSYLVSTAGNKEIGFDAFSGTIDFRYAKHFSE